VKPILRLLALAIVLVAIGWWLAAGANRGWNINRIPVKVVDDVTGIEGTVWKEKFIPGYEFLALAGGTAIVIFGASFLFRTKRTPQPSNEQAPIHK
jgi:hypothetical protein